MNKLTKKVPSSGFTLIEILIVIGIIAILAAIVLVAVNPAEQFRKAGDAQRASNVNAILNAVGQYMVDNQGNPPGDIPSGVANAANISSGGADICRDLIPNYIAALQADPEETDQSIIRDECDVSDTYDTGYKIYEDGDRITIVADQGDDDITVTR
jgi:type IV pilus assembly protein PilA